MQPLHGLPILRHQTIRPRSVRCAPGSPPRRHAVLAEEPLLLAEFPLALPGPLLRGPGLAAFGVLGEGTCNFILVSNGGVDVWVGMGESRGWAY